MTTTVHPAVRNEASWLRLVRIGTGFAIVGLVVFWTAGTFWPTVSEGDFENAADYWYTASAVPFGSGLLLHVLGVHRLQGGRDGRLGVVGAWVYALCSAELVVQCLCSALVGAELRWGPTYVLSSLGTFVGLALLAAGSWRAGLLPRWMLGVWPPLALLGSWAAIGPVPLVLVLFLVVSTAMLGRRPAGSAAAP